MYKGKGDSTMRKWTALLCLILALCLLGGCTTQQEKAKVPISWYLRTDDEIGRASCRERGIMYVEA